MRRPLPGDIVMRRVEWFVDSHLMGTVIGHIDESRCLVMWIKEDGTSVLRQHYIDALRVVGDDDEERLKKRRCIT